LLKPGRINARWSFELKGIQ